MRTPKLFALALAAALPFAAQADHTPAHKLEYIQSKVGVTSSAGLTHIRRIQAINSLYAAMTDAAYAQYFGPEALVRQVRLSEAIGFDLEDAASLEAFSTLHGNTLNVSTGGESLRVFKTRAEAEARTLRDIASIQIELKLQFPTLTIVRKSDSDYQVSTNTSYLSLLQKLQNELSHFQARGALAPYSKIVVNDAVTNYETTQISTYSQRTTAGVEKILYLTVGRVESDEAGLLLGTDTMYHLLIMVVDLGFKNVGGVLLKRAQILEAVANLYAFLTPANVERLRAGGVTSFNFSSNWQNSTDLLVNGTLTLGVTTEEMREVADLLFP